MDSRKSRPGSKTMVAGFTPSARYQTDGRLNMCVVSYFNMTDSGGGLSVGEMGLLVCLRV